MSVVSLAWPNVRPRRTRNEAADHVDPAEIHDADEDVDDESDGPNVEDTPDAEDAASFTPTPKSKLLDDMCALRASTTNQKAQPSNVFPFSSMPMGAATPVDFLLADCSITVVCPLSFCGAYLSAITTKCLSCNNVTMHGWSNRFRALVDLDCKQSYAAACEKMWLDLSR
ncbi:hypothetical protein SPRG_09260 [Saprolegnia parasitica CBS 223.65]|uniref:Uncharacterized protein n=1 Tax=Saprolegnia parasitica (strain CBS 223.65) TaxID=695850 RepID=A0A067C2W8_SAPPC|nr:hypothetical protein SPRG_09260 [Saprolegnia parasitica CBS 223.65]KDO25114.1 hypothetical protein SPRG_09260 [Saprolegnia parasitica CBS 223.65]|eukprot:XP_012204184.1 hypothetical protein SPRG_09260 [Saprolegnia parasitica CBS 223.65]